MPVHAAPDVRSEDMTCSAVLIAYHGDRWLPPCLESLAQASAEPLHLVLVDNDGNSMLSDLNLSAFDTEVLQTPRPMGFAEANNFALTSASHLEETVLFLNQDTISPPGWVDSCYDALSATPGLGAVSPLIRTYEDDGWDPSFLACLSGDQQAALEETEPLDDVVITRNAPAPALMMRTGVLHQTGPFDPVFGSYYEDYDLCRRIRAAGYQVGVCTKAHIRHFSGGSTITEAQERRRTRQVIRNRALYELRESDEPRWRGAARWVFGDLPRRIVRGVIGTPSSQPPTVTLQAYSDLLRLGRRFVSARYDEAAWHAYLEEIGWPPEKETPQHTHIAPEEVS